ncbi:MAG: hypothetical protein GX588_03955 [Clostridiaceae bacterium]|nr:hypothetical protein [Clostridiaceae bacterium]
MDRAEQRTVVHSGDLHLGGSSLRPEGGNSAETRFQVFQDLLELCRSEGADVLLLAGDVLEQDALAPASLSRVLTLLGGLAAEGVEIFITPGNHDAATPLSPYRDAGLWPEGVHVLVEPETVALPELGLSVSGAGFRSLYQRQPLLPLLSAVYESARSAGELEGCPLALALLHGDLRHGPGGLYNPIDPLDIAASPFAYLALAHIHQPDHEIRKAGSCRYAFCGTTQGASRLDEGPRGCYVLKFTDGRWDSARFVDLAATVYRNVAVELQKPENVEQAARQCIAKLREAALAEDEERQVVYYMTLHGFSAGSYLPDPEILQSRLEAEGYVFSGLLDRTSPEMDPAKLEEEDSLRGLFYRSLSRQAARAAAEDQQLCERALRLGMDAFRSELL